MKVSSCQPYHAMASGKATVRMPDGLSAFKIYYLSIPGREARHRYEWEQCGIDRAAFQSRFAASGLEGIGFVTAFPHVTKVFRFAPSGETVLHVRALDTAELSPLGLDREDGFVEFACYAEAVISADEYHAWARARDVPEYLSAWSGFESGRIENCAKLRDAFGG